MAAAKAQAWTMRAMPLSGLLALVVLAACAGESPVETAASETAPPGTAPEEEGTYSHAHSALRGTTKRAAVALPALADGAFHLQDRETGTSAWVRLQGARAVPGEHVDGVTVYPRGGPNGEDVLHHVTEIGTEDFVMLDRPPAEPLVEYELTIGEGVAGLRLVESTLELLDARGTPRLRMAPPYLVDAARRRAFASVALTGCAFDTDPRGPWGRPPTPPGATQCTLTLTWSRDMEYPAVLDPAWTTTGDMISPRAQHASSVLANGRVLVAGGYPNINNEIIALAELYNPATETWSSTGKLARDRVRHTATRLLDGRVLVTGGYSYTTYSDLSTAEIYDPALGGWSPAGNMAVTRSSHTATLLDGGKVLVVGGTGNFPSPPAHWSAELYDPATGAWTPSGNLVNGRRDHDASKLQDGRVLVTGGLGNTPSGTWYIYSPPQASAELYNPASGSWTLTASMGIARERHTQSTRSDGKVLVAGGRNAAGNKLASAEVFDPASSGSWAPAGSLGAGRFNHTATLLEGGRILVTGGGECPSVGTYLASAEVFDPLTGLWGSVGDMAAKRCGHTADLLKGGEVLVAGGDFFYNPGSGDNSAKTPEIFSPAPPGGACAFTGECTSGICAPGGICCNTACTGVCMACVAAKTGVADGTCAPVVKGTDPDDECLDLGPSSCSFAGACNGTGACQIYPAGTPCLPASCDGGVLVTGTCMSANVCAAQPQSCAPYACAGPSACATACGSNSDCAVSAHCAPSGLCEMDLSPGAPCGSHAECASGHCVDGVCCESACGGPCRACSAQKTGGANGLCASIPAGFDPDGECPDEGPASCSLDGSCDGEGDCHAYGSGTPCSPGGCLGGSAVEYLCSASGVCTPALAECGPAPCDEGVCLTGCQTTEDCSATGWCEGRICIPRSPDGADCTVSEECLSGACVDGFCCNTSCEGQCEACGEPGAEGVCVPVSGDPRGARPACDAEANESPCAATTCDGVEADACTGLVGSHVVCAAAACDGGLSTPEARCDGLGHCQSVDAAPCLPYVCGPAACRTSCDSDADCAQEYRCHDHKCVSGAVCDGDHTVITPGGEALDCGRYRCEANGACRSSCASVEHCARPFVCDGTGSCVERPARSFFGDAGGCSVAPGREQRGPRTIEWGLFGAVVLALRRRRGRGPRLGGLLIGALLAGASGCAGAPESMPVGGGAPEGAESTAADTVSPASPFDARAGRDSRPRVEVTLPALASGASRIVDVASGLWAEIRLRGALDVEQEAAPGLAIYPGGHESGADVIHRRTAEGMEDYARFPRAPPVPELDYELTLGAAVAGLRFVGGTLELLDHGGAPRLRMAPPYVVDATGKRAPAAVSIGGCRTDSDPRSPWHRSVTQPGASTCIVHVRWDPDQRYPLLVDPLWTSTTNMLYPRDGLVAAVLANGGPLTDGKVLVTGGHYYPSGWVNVLPAELYDPSSGTWAVTGSMTVGRNDPSASLFPDGRVMVLLGNSGVPGPSAEIYQPASGMWSFSATPPHDRNWHTATVLSNGDILVLGSLNVTDLYHPASDTWTGAPPMSDFHYLATATRLPDGKVLVAGGNSAAAAELYDPVTSTWGAAASLITQRHSHRAALLVDGRVLVVGGKDIASAYLSTSEVYDPSADAWVQPASLSTWRVSHTITLLDNGRVLVAGGGDSLTYFSSAEIYDPAAAVWANGGSLAAGRGRHTQSLLPSGQVLVAGGKNGIDISQSALATAELFTLAPLGAACTHFVQCASGHCADGKCCETACEGVCLACAASKTGTADGACAPVVAGTDPDSDCPHQLAVLCGFDGQCDGSGACRFHPAGTVCGKYCLGGTIVNQACDGVGQCLSSQTSCAPYFCDGNGQCATQCSGDGECVPSSYCLNSDGACHPDQADGSPCAGGSQCQSGHCVDGVCCDGACTQPCHACAFAVTDAPSGICAPAKDGVDPHGDCPDQGAWNCGLDGSCDGSGGCRRYPAETKCGVSVCSEGASVEARCDGVGTCEHSAVECGDYDCEGGACLTGCAAGEDCAPGAFCLDGECTPQFPPGDHPCETGEECTTGLCVDGFCCNAPCSGICEACDLPGAEGACLPVPPGGQPHGKGPCPEGTGDPCSAATCNGVDRDACLGYVGAAVKCRDAGCEAGVEMLAEYCDGAGHCPPPVTKACEPFACGALQCSATCADSSGCAPGYHCEGGLCQNGGCIADGVLLSAGGETHDCAPYACDFDRGGCLSRCASVADCVAPAACDAEGKCVRRPDARGATEIGCSAGPGHGLASGAWRTAVALLALLAFARRLRARAHRPSSAARTGRGPAR